MSKFSNRAQYLAYIANWKATYATNSETIRSLKGQIKEASRAGDSGNEQRMKGYLRRIQRQALIELADAKLEAQEQYLASRSLVIA